MAISLRDYKTSQRSPTPNEAYQAAIDTQSADYDRLMKMYGGLFSGPSATPLTRTIFDYETDPLLAGQISNVTNLAKTGGYSESDLGSIRARSLSPIRAAYANAQRNANRATRLAGGYSPNAGAVQAKLAREQSDVLSSASRNTEADIADRVSSGRLNYNNMLNPLLAREASERTRVGELNARNLRDAELFDAEQLSADFQRRMAALNSMTSLYSTSPGLIGLFGQQALQERGQDISGGIKPRSSRIGVRDLG